MICNNVAKVLHCSCASPVHASVVLDMIRTSRDAEPVYRSADKVVEMRTALCKGLNQSASKKDRTCDAGFVMSCSISDTSRIGPCCRLTCSCSMRHNALHKIHHLQALQATVSQGAKTILPVLLKHMSQVPSHPRQHQFYCAESM